jgi:ribosomal protein L44E
MIVPREERTYCPNCRTHTVQKVKVTTTKIKPGRTLAWGSRRHERKLAGFHGKVKGKAKVKKQGIRNKIMLECAQCKKKHERVISGRMKKKAELQKT